MSEEKKLFPEPKIFEIGGEKLSVKPYVLRDRKKVMAILSEMFAELSGKSAQVKVNDLLAGSSILALLAGDKLTEIYVITLGKEKEWLETNLTMRNEVEIIEAILEVNEISFLLNRATAMTPKKETKAS